MATFIFWMKPQSGKKGMFLTFISIAIIAAAIIIFTPSNISLGKDIPVIKTRVSNVNEYVLDLENVYLERTLQATGIKTIKALIGYVESQGPFSTITDFENAFSEVLLCGKIGSSIADCTSGTPIGDFINPAYMDPNIMAGNTYKDWADRVAAAAENTLNVDTAYSVSSIRIYQITPWFANADADISFTVSTDEGTASWAKDITINTGIEIKGFDDPYYLAKTGGAYINKIEKTNTQFSEWNAAKVKDFIRGGDYTHFQNSNAPSFLMRFADESTWNQPQFDSQKKDYGIESIVNPNKLDILDRDKALSYIDYKFFPLWQSAPLCNDVTQTLYTETSIESEFNNIKFDIDDLVKYKIRDDQLADVQQECPLP